MHRLLRPAPARVTLLLLMAMAAATSISSCRSAGCPTLPFTDGTEALHAFSSLHRTVRAVRGEARVDRRSSEDGRVRGTVLLYHERPDRVRFDVMTQLGPAAVMTSDGEDFQLLDLQNSRFVSGPATPDNVHRLVGVSLPGSDIARLLLGDSPRLPGEPTLRCTSEGYLIEISHRGLRQEMLFTVRDGDEGVPPDAQHLRLIRSELFANTPEDRETLWRVTFEDHEVVLDPDDPEGRGVALPFVVHFEDPRRGSDTLIRFKSRTIVTDPAPPGAFEQEAPAGVTLETL